MEKITEEDAAYYRQRTVARLIDKRRQIETQEQKEAELKKLEDMKFRIQWKEGFKKKRSELISAKVDKQILQRALRANPDLQSHVMNMEKFGVTDARDDEVLADLDDHFNGGDVGADSPLLHPAMQAGAQYMPGAKPNPALQFLQNAATFNLSVNARLREHQQSTKPAFDPSRSLPDTADGSQLSAADHRKNLRRSFSATDHDLASDNAPVKVAKTHDSKAFSSYRSEVQVSKLVMTLLQDMPPAASLKDGADAVPGVIGADKSIVSQLAGRPIKTSGLMSKLFRNESATRQLGSSSIEHNTSFTLHRSAAPTPSNRMLASGTKRSGGDAASALSGGGVSAGSNGSVVSSDEATSKHHATTSPSDAALSNNAMFSSLVDCMFLMGPSARSIQEQIELRRDDRVDASTTASTATSSSNAAAVTQSVPDFNSIVPPTVIFCTENNYPAEMASLLPCYCFPSDVEMSVRSPKTANAGAAPGKRKKNSLNLLTQKIITESVTDIAKGTKKRNAVFFPSDFNLGMGITAAAPKADAAVLASIAEPALPAINANITTRNPFVIMLGDHTYQQFGVCIQLPATFRTEQGLTIQTSYVLCLMTKVPFFSYLFHILEQFDAYFDGFKYREPIPTQDMSFPFVAELRPLSDLATKLKRLLVPKYPYIISTALHNPPTMGRSRANTGVISPSETGAAGRSATDVLSTEYPALDNDNDTKALLPDVEFSYGAVAASRKVQLTFKRSSYQAYFSSTGMKFDSGNKALTDLIARYDKMVADFVPNAAHRSEKEKEETYMIMLWALPVLLKHLPLDQIVLALGCAITEMRIVVKHPDLHVVSSVIMALLQLLRPLKWCSPVVVIMPDSFDGMLDAPTPVMIGLQKLPAHFTLVEGYVVIDPLERIVHLNPIDVVEAHTILLPHGSKLVNALRPSAETILRCTKKKRNTRYRRSIPSEPDPTEALPAASAGAASGPLPPLPLPVELDLDSYENLQMLAAIKTFTGLVSNHILAILNTAIQMQQQSKQASQDQRRLLIKSTSGTNQNKSTKAKPPAPTQAAPVPPALPSVPSALPIAVPVATPRDVAAESSTVGLNQSMQSLAAPTSQQPIDATRANISTFSMNAGDAGSSGKTPTTLSPALSSSRELKPSAGAATKRSRQSDVGPGMHGLAEPHEGGKKSSAARTRSPAGRHSLPPTLKKQSPRRDRESTDGEERESPSKMGVPAKAKDFADKLKAQSKHTPASTHAGKDRKSLNGGAKPGKDAKKTPVPPIDRKGGLGASGTLSKDVTPTKQVVSPRLSDEGEVETKPTAPAATAPQTAPQEQPGAAATATSDFSGSQSAFSPLPSGRTAGGALVLNIDSLVSPFVMPPSPKIRLQKRPNPVGSPVFVNLPANDGPAEDPARDSLNDETCSEITVTDAGGVHAADDGSAGNRVRTASSNDSGDKMSDAVESVCSSTSSSLPSLKSNAPLLLVREIGQSGAKFMDKIQQTQMYSNYCQAIKMQSALAASRRAAEEKLAQEGLAASADVAAFEELGLLSPKSPNANAWSHLSLAPAFEAQLTGADKCDEDDQPMELDALHEVFSIALTGTTRMPVQTMEAQVAAYDKLYAGRAPLQWEEIRAKYADELRGDLANGVDSVYATMVAKYSESCLNNVINLDADFRDSAGKEDDQVSGYPALLWCNGLVCRGLCNTALCTSICLALWVEKVKRLRQHAAFRGIVSKKHPSKMLLRTHAASTHDLLSPEKGDSVALDRDGALVSKVDVIRHHKETQSQYEQRKNLVENKKFELYRLTSPAASKVALSKASVEKSRSVYGPAQGEGKNSLYARGSTADSATLAIAEHYARQQQRYRKNQLRRALRVITPLMLRFVCLYRKYKFFNAIYLIQALIRGFYVRNHIPELVEALIARRIRRLLACIRIRRYLRQHADHIYRRYLRAKELEMRRRRAMISIPVSTTSTRTDNSSSSRHNPSAKVPRKVYAISDDILPSSGISIVGIDRESKPSSPPKPSHKTIALEKVPLSAAEVGALANEKAVVAPNKGAGGFSEEGAAAVDATSEGSGRPLPPEGGEFAGVETTSAKETAPPKPQQRFSTAGAYSERVKEYLQFGKILNRHASISVQPNKYAEHYIKKRNSKTSATAPGAAPGASEGLTPADLAVDAAAAMAMDAAAVAVVTVTESVAVESVTMTDIPATPAAPPMRAKSLTAASLLWDNIEHPDAPAPEVRAPPPATSTSASADSAVHSHRFAKPELIISTRFSSDESSEGASSKSNTLAAESVVSTPLSASVLGQSTDRMSADGVVASIPAPEVFSPTSGIRILDVHYPDSDEDEEEAARGKSHSLVFSELGSGDESPLSLLAIGLVEGSMKNALGSSGDLAGDPRGIRPPGTRLTGDEDDRASVLSSNSNSTTPKRRTSTSGSTTDAETSQPMLLSILAAPHVRSLQSMAIAALSEGADKADRASIRSSEGEPTVGEHDKSGPPTGDDVTVVSQSSVRTNRSSMRNSLPSSSAASLLLESNQLKKLSPIGRYAAEKSYDMAKLFTPRTGGAAGSKVPFQADTDMLLSPQGQEKPGLPVHPPLRTPKTSVFGDSVRQSRHQTFMIGSNSTSGYRRFGSSSVEEYPDSFSASEKVTFHKSALEPGVPRSMSELTGSRDSHSADGEFRRSGDQAVEDEHYTWGGQGGASSDARRRNTLHAQLPRSPLHGTTVSTAVAAVPAGGVDAHGVSTKVDGARTSESSDRAPPSEAADRSEQLQYHLHSKSSSPRNVHADSPVRPNVEYRKAIDQEGKKLDVAAAAAPSARSPRSDHVRHRGYSEDPGEDPEDEEEELEFTALDDLQEAVKRAPLKTLGCNVTEYINRQQLHTLQDMWNHLRKGVDILKHGRQGNPKFKTLLCDVNMTKLYWRSQGSKPDRDLDDLPEDANYYPTLLDPAAPASALASGVPPVCPTPSGGTSRLTRTPFGAKSNADRVLYIRDILEVREDCSTEVMQRSVAKGHLTAGRTSTISIIWEDRTLDFEIEEVAWGPLFHALQILVNFYQVMVAAPRASIAGARPPEGFFNFLSYDTTGSLSGGVGSGKRRASNSIGSMLLNRRSSRADVEENAHLL